MSAVRRAAAAAALVLSATAAAAQDRAAPADPAAVIRPLEEALAAALQARDRARLEPLLAGDYRLRGTPDVDRDTWLRNAVALCWGDRVAIDDFTADRADGAVIATFTMTFTADPVTCRPAILRSLITDVWAREDGAWRLRVRHAGPPPAGGIAAQYGLVPDPPPTWAATSELSLVATSGNTSTRTIGLGGTVTHRGPAATTRAEIAFLESEVDDVTRAQALTAAGRYGVRVGSGLQLFGEGSYGRDRFAGLARRVAATGGVSHTATWPGALVLTSDAGIGVTGERRLDARDRRFLTATGAVRAVWTIARGAELGTDGRVDADLQSGENWRGQTAAALRITLNRLLSFRFSHTLDYRHLPVAGFGRSDQRTAGTLVLNFERRPAAP